MDRLTISVTPARRLRTVLLLVGGIVLFTVWEIGSAWRWYHQSLAVLFSGLILYGLLRVVRTLGGLPTLLPQAFATILRAGPRPLIAPTSAALMVVSILLLLIGLRLYPTSAARGYNLTVYRPQAPDVPIYETCLTSATFQPFDMADLLHNPSSAIIHLSGYVFLPQSSSFKPNLYTSSGKTQLLLDGLEVGRIQRNPADRVTIPTLELSSGWHLLEIIHTTQGGPPTLDLEWSIETDSGYFPIQLNSVRNLQDCVHPWRHHVTRVFSTACVVIATFLLISVLISWVSWHGETLPTVPRIVATLSLLSVCLVGIGWGRWKLLQHTSAVIEADEAAFGLMAQRLLRGELPPVFHYGQTYQGTLEVVPVALLFAVLGASPTTLKLEPLILYTTFSLILLLLYRRLCTLTETLVLVAMLVCSPFLLMWISLKAWFGYAGTLCSSGLVLLSTYKLVYRPGPRDRYWIVLLGLASGISLYILPSALPAVLSAVLLLVRCRRKHRWQAVCLAGAVTLAVALPPYVLHDLTSEQKSLSFLVQGRELGTPRVAGEHPFADRFLDECFPVIVGGRTTYDQQRDLPIDDLPRVLYLITLVGTFLLLADLREDCKWFIHGQPPGRLLLVLPAVLAVPIGVFSPFGIWPWYFLQLYAGLPLIWAALVKFSIRHARPIGLAAISVCLTVWVAGTTSRPDLMFQPASLVQTGVILREDNTPVIDALLQRGVHHVICDQGGDFTDRSTGRDWMGERLTFESGLRITAINPLTRRHPHLFADTKSADRVAYLFGRSLVFWDFDHVKEPGYKAITFELLSRLFGPDYLNYTRLNLDNEVLFIPERDHLSNSKALWRVTASRGWFFHRMHDHSISSRAYGPTYWSSGPASQTPGDFVEIDTGQIMSMHGIVMFHGVKTLDRPRSAKVHVSQDKKQWWEMGRTVWDEAASVTSWRHSEPFHARYIRIELTEATDTWWTIYELWII